MTGPIYLDYNATTPVDPEVARAMSPYLSHSYGNASSDHVYGIEARRAVEGARTQVAALIGAHPSEIVFTGGGSEADNLAIKGTVFANLDRNPHIVSSVTEHPAVLNTLYYLKTRFGVDFTLIPVDEQGMVSPFEVQRALRSETVLVTIMHANNEVGSLQPLADIGRVTREAGVLFHTDAAQSTGKVTIDIAELGVDLLTIAGHKLYGPKGVGALYIRHGVPIDSLIHGSSQEHGMRAGTENVPALVGLGAAADIARRHLPEEMPRLRTLRDALHACLVAGIPNIQLNGHAEKRLPNTLNVSFPNVLGQAVLTSTPAVVASTGSACHSGMAEPSPVLLAMGLSVERALGAVRLSIGRWSTVDEIERAGEALSVAYHDLARTPALR